MSKAKTAAKWTGITLGALFAIGLVGSTVAPAETETAGTPEPAIVTVQETQAPAPTAAPTTTATPYVAPAPTEALVLLTWMDTGMYGEFFDALDVSMAELDWDGSYDEAVAGCLQAWLSLFEIGEDIYDSSAALMVDLDDAGYSIEVAFLFRDAFDTIYDFVDYCSDGNVDAAGVEMFNDAVEALETFNTEVERIIYAGESA